MTLPALLICRQAQAQEPEIRVGVRDDSSDVCGDKRSLIVVYVDTIVLQDSILGYDLEVRYNPEKLYLTDEIFVSTLTEQFDDHKLTFPEPGLARGWGANILRPVTTVQQGQPLIAMSGEFIGNCNDTAHVEVSFISFAHVKNDDVFDVAGVTERKGVAKAIIRDRQDRHVTAVVESTPVELKGLQVSESITISLQNGAGKGMTTATVEIAVDNPEQFTVQNITAAPGVLIEDIQSGEGVWIVQIAMGEDWVLEEALQFHIATTGNKDDSARVAVRPVQVNNCACVTRLLGSGVELRSSKEISVSVADEPESMDKTPLVIYTDAGWSIRCAEPIQFVRLATLLGQNMKMEYTTGSTVVIDNTQLSRGLYLLQIGTGQKTRTIIVEKL